MVTGLVNMDGDILHLGVFRGDECHMFPIKLVRGLVLVSFYIYFYYNAEPSARATLIASYFNPSEST